MEIIAYYLPQYHSIKENDEWWGKGFTEWTNVAKARPLFKGHEQPHIPADLGFYNLLNIDDQKAQIRYAKDAGISAFCYWHYWFGNGRLLLEKPIKNVLNNKEIDLPFCFGWANESWQSKVWSSNGMSRGKVLMEQLYLGDDDILNHFNYLKPYLLDSRYYRIKGRPVFTIYRPYQLKNAQHFLETFNRLIKESGIADSFYFIGHTIDDKEIGDLLSLYDAVNIVRVGCYRYDKELIKRITFRLFRYKVFNTPLVLQYKKLINYFSKEIDRNERVIPTLIPSWDHTPRSGKKGVVFQGSNPILFEEHVNRVYSMVKDKKEPIVFLKSWNEWGEGNYIEPDTKYGIQYLNVLSKINSKDE